MTDQLRPGQRLIVFGHLVRKRKENFPPSEFEQWLWNASEAEFNEAMKWRME